MYRIDGDVFDCFQAAITTELIKNKIDPIFVWAQLDFKIIKVNNLFQMDNYRFGFTERLQESFSLSLEYTKNLTVDKNFIESIRRGDIIRVDTYFLPYCLLFKREHSGHYINIVSIDETGYLVIDKYFNFEGYITKEELEEILKKPIESNFFQDATKFQVVNNLGKFESVDEIIRKNIKLLENEISGKYNYSYIKKIIEQEGVNLESVYSALKTTSNSRYHFRQFIEVNFPHNEMLKQYIRDSEITWRTLANFILLLNSTKNTKILKQGIDLRIDLLFESESKILIELKKIVRKGINENKDKR
ncbi:hypothetical protein FZX01_03750 [Listeria monocytogenes]|uniref:hypothetical protein n=1 Tax=Listeria monocytogenes TaxID=1639 RepID=UPI0011EB7DAF|nr:hypothetical protein [Listeria monocytogenes]TYU88636.1 hypothetical protein FZX01_03750 [Listeria monocytogenes]